MKGVNFMIIVSQDKMQIVSFENINNITIEWSRIFSYSNNYNGKEETKALLGQYKTIERAKEVLQEILERYDVLKKNTTYAQGDSGFTFNEHYYYEMPKE